MPHLAAGLIAIALGITRAYGDDSALHKFEKSVQPPPAPAAPAVPTQTRAPEPGHSAEERSHNCDADDLDPSCLLVSLVGDLSAATMQRLDAGADPAIRRNEGDILLPFVRYDFFRQSVATNVSANNHRLEAGIGPVALMIEHYVFREQVPNATLSIDRQMFLYRTSFNRAVEVDFGMGQTMVSSLSSTSLATMSLPVKISFNDNLSFELRPTKCNTMDDYEAALHWGGQYGSLKIGYRTLIGNGASLKGPFAGFAVYY